MPRYLAVNFELFFEKYNDILIKSDSYVTKRQSLKLLGEVLLDRQFYEVMTRYVDSGENLKLIMYQLKDDRRMVQYEAFPSLQLIYSLAPVTIWSMESTHKSLVTPYRCVPGPAPL